MPTSDTLRDSRHAILIHATTAAMLRWEALRRGDDQLYTTLLGTVHMAYAMLEVINELQEAAPDRLGAVLERIDEEIDFNDELDVILAERAREIGIPAPTRKTPR